MADKKDDEDKDAAGAEGGEAEGGGPVKGKRKLIIILIIALLLLLGAAGAGLYFSGILGGGEEHAEGEAPAAEGEAPAEGEHGEAPAEGEHGEGAAPAGPQVAFYDLPEFLVNLNTNGGRTSFLKMKVALELENSGQTVTIQAYEPKIVDSFNTYLRDLRSTDLSGSAGIHRLREELLLRINKITYPEKVKDVLFKEMIVQ
ncbi:MAG: flagellar basal body-associated FliL family protein [Alphaproteobacteria bacterium]|nr:flagellar basal body-associated FliL family protein [Alphaproteobacteria bacterium]